MSNKYISVDEYLMARATLETLSDDIVANINTLIPKVNEMMELFYLDNPDEPKHGTSSGIRLMVDHLRIYENINRKRKEQGLEEIKIPMGSWHLKGGAIDIADGNNKLKEWIKNNIEKVQKIELYFEDFAHTPTWVHAQCFAPKSGHTFFIP